MDRRIEKTKQAIKNAYFEILKEKKGGKISITEIARRANIDRKTFYLHYESTDEILNDICENVITETLKDINDRNDNENTDISINKLLELLTEKAAENLDMFKVLYSRDEGRSLFDKLKNILINIVTEETKDSFGLNETEFRIYLEFYLSGIISVYSLWLADKLPMTIDEISGIVTKATLKGAEGILS